MIAALLAATRLCGAITATWPDVEPRLACEAALAIELERDHWPADLVAAIAYHESRFLLDRTGSRGECGPMQVAHPLRFRVARCEAARADVFTAYAQGVAALNAALAYCGGADGFCALNVYAAGPRGKRLRVPGGAQREFIELRDALALRREPSA